jgi:tRNA 5-methylaminomethyl-2-thiouridine biosynthesis bifunctional protein
MPELTPANIERDASGTPYAPDFADCYFSMQGGLAESRHVFLQGNGLPSRWQNRAQFTIAETGFGTGLNFLATWQAWQQDPHRCERLHFISIEKHPIRRDALCSLLAAWPELAPYANELLANYPPLLSGFHRLRLAGGRIILILCFLDVLAVLPEIVARVDAWYLDGFAPVRNPAMWQLPVLQGIASLCHADATLATYTAASEVRRTLQAAGFVVEKRPGFGTKREMLTANLVEAHGIRRFSARPAWFSLPESLTPQRVTVVGGGIAGCQIARSLAERGWQVTLLERHTRLATEASGNRAGVLTPKMTAEPGWGETFYRQAFTYALQQIRQLEAAGHAIDWAQCGALQLAHEPREAARQQAIRARGLPDDFIQILDAQATSDIAGIPLAVGASYFPQAGWLNPASLCVALVAHEAIEVRTLTAATGPASEGVTIIASGREADQWAQTAFLPFLPVMGQTSRGAASPDSTKLKTTLGHEGYLTPALEGQHIFGATFARHVRDAVLDEAADMVNFQQLKHYLPALAASLTGVESSHAAIRMTSPDRYPVVGALPDADFFQQAYADLRHGRTRQEYPLARYQPGLFIAAGYGSRGLTTSGLCAELLAAVITGEPLPVQATLYHNLHPARFLIKQLRRG